MRDPSTPFLGRKPAWLTRFEAREQVRIDGLLAGGRPPLVPRWSKVVGVLLAAVMVVLLGQEVWVTSRWPAERARLVAAVRTPPPEGHACSTKAVAPSRDLTWESLDPPDGLPRRFKVVDSCNLRVDPGDVATIVRVVEPDRVRVYVDPIGSYREVGAITGLVVAAWFVIIVAIRGTIRWRRRSASASDV